MYIVGTTDYFNFKLQHNTKRHNRSLFIHRKREPEGVHIKLEGCNRNLQPKEDKQQSSWPSVLYLSYFSTQIWAKSPKPENAITQTILAISGKIASN